MSSNSSENLAPDNIEDLTLSDVEEDETSCLNRPIFIDSNNRVITNLKSTFHSKSKNGDSCTVCYHNKKIDFPSRKSSEDVCTSFEELEISDCEKSPSSILDIGPADVSSYVLVKSDFPSKSQRMTYKGFQSFNPSHYDGNDHDKSDYQKKIKKRDFNFYGTNLMKKDDRPACTFPNLVSNKSLKVADEEALLDDGNDNKLPVVDKSSLTGNYELEFVHVDSEESSTDTEEIILSRNLSCGNAFDTAIRKRAAYANSLQTRGNAKPIENYHVLTDKEGMNDLDKLLYPNKVYKNHLLRSEFDESNEDTEEEELYDDSYTKENILQNSRSKMEWTETDEAGSVKQITEIKTETSIKVSGDDIESGDDDVLSRTTTTTTTRIVTTVTTGDEVEGGDQLRSSMEAVLNQFLSEDAPPQEQSSQPH